MRIAAVLLAAGLSTRFGTADKVTALLDGVPLGIHVARTLLGLDLAARYVVTGRAPLDCPGFVPIANDRPEAGMSRSIGLGVAAARQGGAEAVLIALADMPFVPAGHFAALIARLNAPAGIVASIEAERRMPPALFGSDWFDTLEALDGDQGARPLLARADIVTAPAGTLLDIDRPADLVVAQRHNSG